MTESESNEHYFYDMKGKAITVQQMLDSMSEDSKTLLLHQVKQHMDLT